MDFDFDKKLADIDFSQLGAEDIHKMLKKYIDSIELPSITPDMFLAIVKKFVYRTMINRVFEYELMYMERKSLDVQKGMEFCKELFDHSPEMSDYFTSPEELMQDIYRFLKMPQNSSFLGMKDSLNLLANLSAIKSQKDVKFFPLLDFYAKFYQTMIGEKDDDVFEQLVAKSIGNALYRKYKNDFVVLPVDFLLERMKKSFEEQEGAEMPKEDVPPEFSQRTISFEECFELYSEFFDEEFDGELLKEVKTELRILNCVKPVRKHRNYYCRIYVKLYHWNWTLEKLFDQKVLDAARLANPFVRFWEPEKAPFKVCFAKELEIALESAMKTRYNKSLPKDVKLFEIESEEDRKIGILRTVEYPEFKKILRALKLTVDDFHIIDDQFKSTSKLTEIPVITPYGTYCKFARDSLKDIFDQVSCGMNLLKAVSKENYPKIVTWFEELFDDVFDHKRDYVYFVETWKTDEIIDKAYQDLQQYATETVYKIPDKLRDIELPDYQVISELKKFFPNFPTQEYMDLAIRQVVGMIPMMKKLKSETPFAEHNYGREMQLYFEFASFLAFTADNIVFKAFIMRQERKEIEDGFSFEVYVEKLERTIVKILPTFSAEKYVPFSTIEELLKKEMAQFNTFKYSVVGQKDTKHISKIGQMFTNYFEIRNGTPKTIRRRKVPLQTIKEVEAMMPVDCEIMKMYQDEREREDFASNLTNEQKIERMKQVLEENWKLTMHYRQDIDDPHKFTKFFLNLFIKKGSKY